MTNIFQEYMSKQAIKDRMKINTSGPVITISRQFGCYATKTANDLIEIISKRSANNWDCITKEILEDSAKQLNISSKQVANFFGANEKSFLHDLVVSFSQTKYASDSNIKKTIYAIVRKYAEQGNCIIVGRAGCVIASDIPLSLHIKIVAPFDYRVESVKNRHKLDNKTAENMVIKNEISREGFNDFFKGSIETENLYDIVFNKSKLTNDEIISTIIKFAENRKMI